MEIKNGIKEFEAYKNWTKPKAWYDCLEIILSEFTRSKTVSDGSSESSLEEDPIFQIRIQLAIRSYWILDKP